MGRNKKSRDIITAAFEIHIEYGELQGQARFLLRRALASSARPPTANSASVAGSGVVTDVVPKFVVKRPPVSEELGSSVIANELVTVKVELDPVKFIPGELNATEDDGVVGLLAEFMGRLPESCDPSNAELAE